MKKYNKAELGKLRAEEIKKIALSLGIETNKSRKEILIDKILAKDTSDKKKIPEIEIGIFKKLEIIDDREQKKGNVTINQFIIQVNKSNLLGYFACALIYPNNYETRELARSQRAKDIQSFASDYLLLTDGFADTPSEEQVLLAVVLTEMDKQKLVRLDEKVYLLPYPLPISRVQKILFASRESQENSIAIANTFQDAFLPEHLFAIWNDKIPNQTVSVKKYLQSYIPQNKSIKTQSQIHFDRVLGMLAFMKNAELYYANETYDYSIYGEKYLQVLAVINPLFAVMQIEQLDTANKEYYQALVKPEKYSNMSNLQKIVQNIYADETFKRDIFKQILGTPVLEVQEAFQLLVGDETLKALLALQKLKQPELILLAFLYRFRDKEGSDKFALKEQITQLINLSELGDSKALNRVSIVLATLGLYYGYRRLPKDENIKLADSFYNSFGEKYNIKYKLNNPLDRNIIESVYQFCFGKQQNKLDYLPNDNYKHKYQNIPVKYDDRSFELCGTPIDKFSPVTGKENQTAIDLVKSILDFVKKNSLVSGEVLNERKLKRLLLKEGSKFLKLPNGLKIQDEYTNNQG